MEPAKTHPSQPASSETLIVAAQDAGRRLDQFLAAPLGSRAQAARLIEAGLVTVNGARVQKRRLLDAGDTVEVQPEPLVLASGPAPGPTRLDQAPYTVAYEDAHLLVVDKPAGVVVHPARGHQQGTLAQALADRAAGGGDPVRAGIVHRLDKDTSGLLVVAKSEQAHRALREMIAARAVAREYLALVDGQPPARTGTIEAAIGRDRRNRVLISLETDLPRDARTHFEVLETFAATALLRLALDTGRTHQIRVHLQAIGHPVTGDRTYGGARRYGLQRQFLHAARLAFEHPVSHEPIEVSSPLPDDLERALQLARGAG